MLIVGCQTCSETKVLAGAPDMDGVARVTWTCSRCGTGQVLQLNIGTDASVGDLRKILGGLALGEKEHLGFLDELPDLQIESFTE